jgi:hypothetical protein
MLELLAAPALAAGIVSILAWNVRAGLVTGALLLCAELGVISGATLWGWT